MSVSQELSPTPYDGKEALIVGDHPHTGIVAICKGAERTSVGWALLFKAKDANYHTQEFFVFDPKHVKKI